MLDILVSIDPDGELKYLTPLIKEWELSPKMLKPFPTELSASELLSLIHSTKFVVRSEPPTECITLA